MLLSITGITYRAIAFSFPIVNRSAGDVSTETSSYPLCNSVGPHHIADSVCDSYNNNDECGYDGGDCCECETEGDCRIPVIMCNGVSIRTYKRYQEADKKEDLSPVSIDLDSCLTHPWLWGGHFYFERGM